MGGLAEAQFANAVEAIARRDTGLAENAVGGDKRIDAAAAVESRIRR